MAETADGYLWLGTKRGLVRFDGLAFTPALYGGAASRLVHSVTDLLYASDGWLWIAFEQDGLARYRKGAVESVIGPEHGWGTRIHVLAEASDGTIWAGAEDGLVRIRNGKAATLYTRADGLPDNRISALYAEKSGGLLIGTAAPGLGAFRDGAFAPVRVRGGPPLGPVRAVCRDRAGALWVAAGSGVSVYAEAGDGSLVRRRLYPAPSVRALREDRDGALWLGGWGRVDRVKDGVRTTHVLSEGRSENQVAAIFASREGSLWVGTRHYGLFRLWSGRFGSYTRRDGLSNDSVKAILEDRSGTVWLGADAGLNRLVGGRVLGFPAGHEFSGANVRSLAEDPAGGLWVGLDRGLFRWREGRASAVIDEQGSMLAGVSALCRTRDGTLWIGCRGGLWRYREGGRAKPVAGMAGEYVRDLLEARDGALWIATSRRGLKRLDDGRLTHWTASEGLSGNDLQSLYESSDGALWIGTAEDGLCRWSAGRIVRFSAAHGLFDDSIYRILEDARGDLWMSGRKGIYRVARKQLDDFAAGAAKRLSFVPYGVNDGMPSGECRGGHQPAGWKTRDGRLWFATTRGVAVVDPARVEPARPQPAAIVERVQLNGREANPFEQPKTAARAGRIELHYTAPSFSDPRKIRFRYRLQGLESEWVEASFRRAVEYTNLAPGQYRFEVMASDREGAWGSPAAAFAFELTPSFHQTYGFYAACAGVMVLMGFAAHRYRMARAHSRFSAVLAERLRIAREIHDTILQGLTGVSAHLEAISAVLPHSPSAALDALERTRVLARSAVEESRRSILDLRAPAAQTGSLINALKASAERLTAGGDPAVQVEVGGAYRPLPESMERNLLRIGQEAISNAVKHSRAKRITVELSFHDAQVRLAVRDDGRGFQPAEAGRGGHFGILGMRERAAEMGARLELDSAEGQGAVVAVTAPLGKEIWEKRGQSGS